MTTTENEDAVINIEDLRNNVFSYVRDNYVGKVKIPRVPKRLRLGENDAYEPKIISFGPYHRGQERLQDMEEHKERYLRAILARCRSTRDRFKNEIMQLEAKVRNCYSKDIQLEPNEFVNMMMLDGCFIVEYLLRLFLDKVLLLDLTSMMMGVSSLLDYDLLLLENQLPFFLLNHIFNHVKPHQEQLSQLTFADLCIKYFEGKFKIEIRLQPEPIHFLHLYHSTFRVNSKNATAAADGNIGTEERKENIICVAINKIAATVKEKRRKMNVGHTRMERKKKQENVPHMISSATVLHEHGITFKAKGSSILDIKFCNGVLEIPHLLIHDSTASQFRNLIAFEQLYPRLLHGFTSNFTTYARFMDSIVDTPEDVALLCEKGILEHSLGSRKDVSDLFNKLTNGIFGDHPDHYLWELFVDVKDYQNLFWPRCRANLMHNYFHTPWTIISLAAAAILLILTIVQTVFSGISTF